MQTATVVKLNSSNAGTATPEHTLILNGAESFAGRFVTVNGLRSSRPAANVTKSVADGEGHFVDKPTGSIAVPFTRTSENGADIRTIKRLAPGSTVEVAEVAS